MKLTPEQRALAINKLVTNCSCGDADKKALEGLSDTTLVKMVANGFAAEEEEVEEGEEVVDEDAEEEEAHSPKKLIPTGNSAGPQTMKQFMATAPKEVQQIVANALKREASDKAAAIKVIVANNRNKFTAEYLKTKDLEELQALAEMFSEPVANGVQRFIGANGAPINNAGQPDEGADEVLETPTINFAEEAKQRRA
jgi:hypothetical protein